MSKSINLLSQSEFDVIEHLRINNVEVYRGKRALPLFGTHILHFYKFDVDSDRPIGHILNDMSIDWENISELSDNTGAAFYKTGGQVFLFLGGNKDLISHEAVHAAMHICSDLGVPVKTHNHETFAYLVMWLVAELTEFYYAANWNNDTVVKTGALFNSHE
jgi:hypothetical protein